MNDYRVAGPATKLYSMLEGTPARNLLGIGDPCVRFLDGRWTMFVGGFQLDFKNNLFRLQLPVGAELDSSDWRLVMDPKRPRSALPLVPQPERGAWDAHGLHTPSHVEGRVGDRAVERIYYAGRGSARVVDNLVPYGIGVLERRPDGGWARHPRPVLTGSGESPNVLEPKAFYREGSWRLYYVTTPQEAGKHGEVRYRIEYVESADGLTGWSRPVVVFDEGEGYYDAVVTPRPGSSEDCWLLLCRSTNLYGRQPFPTQGLWVAEGGTAFDSRRNWSLVPEPLLVCDETTPEWYRHGPFGPSLAFPGKTTSAGADACIFFSGVDSRRNWPSLALGNLAKGRLPPPPAPFHFTLGRLDLRKAARSPSEAR